eukprot:gene6212-6449_t
MPCLNQVHLTFWDSSSILVSWASCDARVADKVSALKVSTTNSKVSYGDQSNKYDKSATGSATSYTNDYSSLQGGKQSYASPVLHHVLLTSLTAGKTYFYRLSGSKCGEDDNSISKEYNFTMPAASFPFTLGVLADPGQTYNTTATLDRLMQSKPQLAMLVGDFCYADNWLTFDQQLPSKEYGTYTYQPKWDSWGRLFEPLLSHVPFMHTNGNHEIEQLPDKQRNNAYNHRYPVPSDKQSRVHAAPWSNMYWSTAVPGVFKAIFLTSYSPGQTMSSSEQQYKWLEAELQAVDRKSTPWLIVAIHAPWYNSYAGHFKENECMRQAYEPLLVQHGVDIMFFGHVHAYERTKPIVDYKVNECGPVHITIGDGGNIEGLYKDFMDTISKKPAYCADPESGQQFPKLYQPQACLSYQQGEYCFSKQPQWSAYREPSFGYGSLQFLNATHASWTWHKNQWPAWKAADQVTILRTAKFGRVKCNRQDY